MMKSSTAKPGIDKALNPLMEHLREQVVYRSVHDESCCFAKSLLLLSETAIRKASAHLAVSPCQGASGCVRCNRYRTRDPDSSAGTGGLAFGAGHATLGFEGAPGLGRDALEIQPGQWRGKAAPNGW